MHAEPPAAAASVLQEPGHQLVLREAFQSLNLQQRPEQLRMTVFWSRGDGSGVSHLLVEPVEHILLRHHLKPVAVHFLSQVSVLTLLQLDERRHLGPESLLAQTRQALTETHQELLDLGINELGAVRTNQTSVTGACSGRSAQTSAHLNLVACVSTVTEKPNTPEVFLHEGYTWYLELERTSDYFLEKDIHTHTFVPECLLRPQEVKTRLLHVHLWQMQ